MREELGAVPGGQVEDTKVGQAAGDVGDAAHQPSVLGGGLGIEDEDAPAGERILKDLRPEDAARLPGARLAQHVAVHAALFRREVDRLPGNAPWGKDALLRRETDESVPLGAF